MARKPTAFLSGPGRHPRLGRDSEIPKDGDLIHSRGSGFTRRSRHGRGPSSAPQPTEGVQRRFRPLVETDSGGNRPPFRGGGNRPPLPGKSATVPETPFLVAGFPPEWVAGFLWNHRPVSSESNAKIVLPPERVNKTMRVSSRLAALMQGSAAASINLFERVSFGFIAHDGDECRCIDHHHVGRPLLS